MVKRDESVEARGRNVEEAIASGLAKLRMTREQVEVEIVSRGSRGILGLGAEDARVILTPVGVARRDHDGAGEVAGETVPLPSSAKVMESLEHDPQIPGEDEVEAGAMTVDQEIVEIARDALAGLLKQMMIKATVEPRPPKGTMVEGDNPPPVVLDIRGDDLGVLIGRRGETLAAIQYLLRLMVNRKTRRWVNVVVDVEGYKDRRERQLQQLAQRMAERVVDTQKPVTLEAMPAYERRIVHLALREHPTVMTHSIGEDENRKVMLVLRQ